MKITIEIDQATAHAIKIYLQQLEGIEKPTKDDIRDHIQHVVDESLEDDSFMNEQIQAFKNPYGDESVKQLLENM